ncbi:MAG: hypothetical protein WA432_00125 [Candidatus Babeliaceae bacterium]
MITFLKLALIKTLLLLGYQEQAFKLQLEQAIAQRNIPQVQQLIQQTNTLEQHEYEIKFKSCIDQARKSFLATNTSDELALYSLVAYKQCIPSNVLAQKQIQPLNDKDIALRVQRISDATSYEEKMQYLGIKSTQYNLLYDIESLFKEKLTKAIKAEHLK